MRPQKEKVQYACIILEGCHNKEHIGFYSNTCDTYSSAIPRIKYISTVHLI
uniref:Uncharacterized protein n=1 Tax=Arundo donax TaxID=35708 RepID=A0A0A9C653_ARUDO